jgi:hypothetical protein
MEVGETWRKTIDEEAMEMGKTWRKTIEEEAMEMGKTWGEVKRLANNRTR